MNTIFSRYEAYKLNLDGSLTHHENLDTLNELNEWFYNKKYANMIIKSNKGKFLYVTWNSDNIDFQTSKPLKELNNFIKDYIRG